jgi:hypothetical protein
MILNGKNQLGLAFDKFAQEDLLSLHYEKYIAYGNDLRVKAMAYAQIESLLSDEGNQNYVFRNTALDIASNIKLDKGKFEDLSFITEKLKAKKCTYLMGRHKFFRWFRWGEDSDLMVICVKLTEPNEEDKKEVLANKTMLSGMNQKQIKELIADKKATGLINDKEYKILMDTLTNKNFDDHISRGVFYYMWAIKSGKLHFPENERNEDFEKEMMEFVRLLIFTELSELEAVTLAPKQSVGTKKQGKMMNESNSNVTVVDSTWNKIIHREQGFKVSGHLRLQPYGPEMKYRRLQYIEDFEKTGYTKVIKK